MALRELVVSVCKLSSYCSSILFSKIDSENTGRIGEKQFLEYFAPSGVIVLPFFPDTSNRICNYMTSTVVYFIF